MDGGNGGPPKCGSSGAKNQGLTGTLQPKSLAGRETDRSSQGQKSSTGASMLQKEYRLHQTSFSESQLSSQGICPPGTDLHDNATSKGHVPLKHTIDDAKGITIHNVADIPLPTQAPPSTVRPRSALISTSVPSPALLPSQRQPSACVKPLISFKVDKGGSYNKPEGSKSAIGTIPTPNILASAVTTKPHPSIPKVNTPCILNQPQRSSIIIGTGSMRGSSQKFLPAQVSSSLKNPVSVRPALTESAVVSKTASVNLKATSSLTLSRPSEGLSSLVSYSSSSSDESPSEDNGQDDQEDSSLSSVLDEPMDTRENSSQSISAVAKVMEKKSSVTPEQVKKLYFDKRPEKVDTATAEADADKNTRHQLQGVSGRPYDAVKEQDIHTISIKAINIVKERAKVYSKTDQSKDEKVVSSEKLVKDVNLTRGPERKDEAQSLGISLTVKEVTSEECPPKVPLQQTVIDTSDGQHSLQPEKGKESLQITKEMEHQPFKGELVQKCSVSKVSGREPKAEHVKLASKTEGKVEPQEATGIQKKKESSLRASLPELISVPISEKMYHGDLREYVDDMMRESGKLTCTGKTVPHKVVKNTESGRQPSGVRQEVTKNTDTGRQPLDLRQEIAQNVGTHGQSFDVGQEAAKKAGTVRQLLNARQEVAKNTGTREQPLNVGQEAAKNAETRIEPLDLRQEVAKNAVTCGQPSDVGQDAAKNTGTVRQPLNARQEVAKNTGTREQPLNYGQEAAKDAETRIEPLDLRQEVAKNAVTGKKPFDLGKMKLRRLEFLDNLHILDRKLQRKLELTDNLQMLDRKLTSMLKLGDNHWTFDRK